MLKFQGSQMNFLNPFTVARIFFKPSSASVTWKNESAAIDPGSHLYQPHFADLKMR